MKILFLTGSLNQGGAEYQILELAKLFKNKGHNIEVFAITDYSFYKPFVDSNELKYSHLFNTQSKFLRIWLTSRKLRKENPDLIISYLKVPSQVALFAKWLSFRKVKLIIGERTSLILPKHDRYYFNLMARCANYIFVNSISKKDYLVKTFPRIEKKIKFSPNIIDICKFKFIQRNYEDETLKIGFVGRVSPEKNVDKLVQAVGVINNNKQKVKLLVFGDTRHTEFLNKVNQFIKADGLEDVVQLMGNTDSVFNAYSQIDILCLISNYEGFSNVLAESLSCGIPIITSNIPENRYLIEDGVNGFVVNHKDPEDIANGLQKYLDLPPALKLLMAETNRKKAEQIFNKDEIYNAYMKVINEL